MPIKSLDYIVTARHYSQRERADGTVRGRILKLREKYHAEKNIPLQIKNLDDPISASVTARIWQGQWLADCECGGAEFVEPTEPIFFCFSCGNRSSGSRVRTVVFPDNYREIEEAVLMRPVNDARGLTDLERAGLAQPVIFVEKEGGVLLPLTRSWTPDETLDDLLEQNEIIETWHVKLKVKNGV